MGTEIKPQGKTEHLPPDGGETPSDGFCYASAARAGLGLAIPGLLVGLVAESTALKGAPQDPPRPNPAGKSIDLLGECAHTRELRPLNGPTEFVARPKNLREEIADFKGLKYTPVTSLSLVVSHDEIGLGLRLILENKIDVRLGRSPEDSLEKVYGHNKELPHELRDHEYKQVVVPPYSLETKLISVNEASISIFDHIQGKVVIQKKVGIALSTAEGSPKISFVDPKAIDKLVAEITAVYNRNEPFYRKHIAAIAADRTAELDQTYQLAHGVKMVENEREGIKQLLAKTPITIEAYGVGREIDSNSSVVVTAESLKRARYTPIIVDGQVEKISMWVDVPASKAGQYKEGTANISKDSSGNVLVEEFRLKTNGTGLERRLTVMFTLPLFNQTTDDPPLTTVTFKLAEWGVGSSELNEFLSQRVIPQIAELGPYRAFSNMPRKVVMERYAAIFPELEHGAAAIERLFGFTPGEKLHSIYIANSHLGNAFFAYANPHVIVIQDEMLEHAQRQDFVARHETVHLIDGFFDFTLSAGTFADLHREILQMEPDFFQAINEVNFLPEVKSGGHAQDNSKEFLASFINTLFHPNWDGAMQDQGPEFRRTYLATLKNLNINLAQCAGIPKNAPIFEILEEKMLALEHFDALDLSKTSFRRLR